jgi:hypothetical protein
LGQRSGAAIVRASYGDPDTVFGRRTHDWLPSPESGLAPAWNLLPALTTELAAGQAPVDAVDFTAVTTAVENSAPLVALGGSSALTPTVAEMHRLPAQAVG